MTFNSEGYLEPGVHTMELDSLEHIFVVGFPHPSTRKLILDGYKEHLTALREVIPSFTQFIDGSFVSNKNDPGDIDLVCFIDGDEIDNLSPDKQARLEELLSGSTVKAKYMCDAYFCVSFPGHHPHFQHARAQRKYWMGEFGYDRQDVPKGIVLIEQKIEPSDTNVEEHGNG
jgi:hypothetical protein